MHALASASASAAVSCRMFIAPALPIRYGDILAFHPGSHGERIAFRCLSRGESTLNRVKSYLCLGNRVLEESPVRLDERVRPATEVTGPPGS